MSTTFQGGAGRKLAALTLDFETDYGGRLGSTFNVLEERERLDELVTLLDELEAPVSAFARTDLLTNDRARALLERIASDFHAHSHTHALDDFDSDYEIPTCQRAFEDAFGEPALGYRAPLGLLREGDVERIQAAGFSFSSSVFPVFFPGRYSNRKRPLTPFRWPNGLAELPLAAVRGVRMTASLSFAKLLGATTHRFLYATFGLPRVVIFNTHLHDFIAAEASFERLPRHLRLAWGIRKHRGPEVCAQIVRSLRASGYEWVTMREVYEDALASDIATG